MQKPFFLALAAALSWPTLALAEVPSVVATIKPLHALVAAVMGDLGTPALIVKGAASPHSYSLKPSDAQALQSANLVFWTGHGLELFLEDSIDTLAPKATIVELSKAPGIELLPPRETGTFEHHDHDEAEHGDEAEPAGETHEHEHGEEQDLHFFLDPGNAKVMVAAIADSLVAADPEHADIYRANASRETADLDALIAETAASLAPIKDRPFVVFHDAYQYFEKRFGLNVAGSVTLSPEIAPGADRINEIRAKLKTLDAACVFAEPVFDPRIVTVLTEGTTAKQGVLDPEGANLDEGPGLYRQLIENLATSLKACLAQ
ncbi:zinc ABC transporter substrate-binding protein [Devosia sp. Root105]|uniref:zinc ABC transporter substrate-binding protein n=1 Tax=Devosia sp. Root105 TaxID=1736423 RepID=UPI0006FFEFA7|nr:zinc ABC transporter substrate-binding protein [Devosia sp. Root105]KQV05894.1 zinc transporter [Devosia sp. Root105]